jgi:hypothetical protein
MNGVGKEEFGADRQQATLALSDVPHLIKDIADKLPNSSTAMMFHFLVFCTLAFVILLNVNRKEIG